MEAHTCNHPLVPHTVVYALGERADVSRPFSDLEGADHFAQKIIRQNSGRLKWIKISRSDNESYSCFYWQQPHRDKSETQQVKLEVDMEPLKSAFENVAFGFKRQGLFLKGLALTNIATIAYLVGEKIF